jgi:hypothetical protein
MQEATGVLCGGLFLSYATGARRSSGEGGVCAHAAGPESATIRGAQVPSSQLTGLLPACVGRGQARAGRGEQRQKNRARVATRTL